MTVVRSNVVRSALALVTTALAAGCAPEAPSTSDEGAEFLEDAVVVEDGKADDFLAVSAREFVVRGTATVTLESSYEGRSAEDRLARATELVSLRQTAIAWFLNQYLVTKERDAGNRDFGGFGGMAKNGDITSLAIRPTEGLTYAFDFAQVVAGRPELMTLIPSRPAADGSRAFELVVGTPTNAELERLETNHEWYRSAPWSEWNPATVTAGQRESLNVTIAPETASHDAWFDFERLFADGVLDIDVHLGWDYHANYHQVHAEELDRWLRSHGYRAPVATFAELGRESGAYTRTLDANGTPVRVEVRLFWGQTGRDTDPDTDAGGRVLEDDMRASFRQRDVIVYSGHSGPFYGFALGNWRRTEEGDLDDSEIATLELPTDRYQIVYAEGCDTYQLGAAFAANPAKPDLRDIDVITTTSFSNAATSEPVSDFITRLTETDSRGRHRPMTVRSLLADLDANPGYGFHTMYGLHGVDDNPRVHPYAVRELFGDECRVNADCGGLGNMCLRDAQGRFCSAACAGDADACGDDFVCRPMASRGNNTIYGSACSR